MVGLRGEIFVQVRGLCRRGVVEISKQVREEWTAWTVCRKYVKKLWGIKLIHEELQLLGLQNNYVFCEEKQSVIT